MNKKQIEELAAELKGKEVPSGGCCCRGNDYDAMYVSESDVKSLTEYLSGGRTFYGSFTLTTARGGTTIRFRRLKTGGVLVEVNP